jgi:AcrR family transcriptional regulator
MSESQQKVRRVRRTKITLERDVNNAVNSLIEELGFANVTLTGVAQRAQIEPTVFYRRYANLEELFDQYSRKYDYWMGNLSDSMPGNLTYEEMFKWILKNLTIALYRNKGMQQLLIWELSNDNAITRRTSKLREETNSSLIKILEDLFKNSGLDMSAITAMLISGIYYLILHRKRSNFCDIDFSGRSGKARLEGAIDQIGTILFAEINRRNEKVVIANKLREEGVSEEIISRCVC